MINCIKCNSKFSPARGDYSKTCHYCKDEDDNFDDELNTLLNPSGKTQAEIEQEESIFK